MTESRPSLSRKHTRASDDKRKSDLNRGLKITVDGDEFVVRIGDVTPDLAAQVRRHTGMSFMRVMDLCGEDPDVDVLTAFEWVARRLRGEDVAYSQVEFSYYDIESDAFDVSEAEPDEAEADDPEA